MAGTVRSNPTRTWREKEWQIEEFLRPEPPVELSGGTCGGASGTGGSWKSGSGSFGATDASGKACWGTTRRTQFESDRRAELKTHQTRRNLPSCVDHHISPALGSYDTPQRRLAASIPQGTTPAPHTRPAKAGCDLAKIWQSGVHSHPTVVQMAKDQQSGAAPEGIPLLEPSRYSNEVVPGALRAAKVDLNAEPGLMSASQRRKEHEMAVAADRARGELASARRTYQRLQFIAKKRYPNGVLMSEGIETEGSALYKDSQERAEKEQRSVDAVRRERQGLIDKSVNRSCDSGTLLSFAPLDPATPFLPRRNHTARIPDTFKISEMQRSLQTRYPPHRQNLLQYTATRGRSRDIITGIPLGAVPENPYS